MKIKMVFLFLSLHSMAFAEVNIIGGTKVSSADWISKTVVALVSRSESGEALCTASLVADDLAVTAAHCLASIEGDKISTLSLVFAHDLKLATPGNIRAVDNGLIPDSGDVALIHFKGGLPAGYSHSDLLPFNKKLKAGESVELAGFGISDATHDTGAGVLRKVKVKILNPEFSATEVEMDQSHGGGACHGDSGGPAYVIINKHPFLFGITSRGGGNCDQDVIYSTISGFADWFKEAGAQLRGKHHAS